MTTTAQLLTSSQRYRPRQFEFHPKNDSLIFGTLTGSIYHISDVTSDERRAINPLGRFNLPNANAYPDDYQNQLHVFDAILGLCWFRNHNHRFISGSQRGILLCGDIRDNGNAEHSIDMAEGSSSSGASSISAQLPTGSPSSYSSSSSSSSSSYLSNNIVKKYETFEKLTSVHLNCDDSYCIVSGYRQDVSLYDVETGEIISTYENAHADNINISRFANISPNIFCTSSFDGNSTRPSPQYCNPPRLTVTRSHSQVVGRSSKACQARLLHQVLKVPPSPSHYSPASSYAVRLAAW